MTDYLYEYNDDEIEILYGDRDDFGYSGNLQKDWYNISDADLEYEKEQMRSIIL